MKKCYILSIFVISQLITQAQTTLYSNNFTAASGATTTSVQTVPSPSGTATNVVAGSPLSTIIGFNATGYTNFNWNITNTTTTISPYSVFAPIVSSYAGASGGNYAVCAGQSSTTTQYGAIVIGPLNTTGYNNIILNFGFAYNIPDTIVRGASTGFTGYGSIAAWYNRTGPASLTSPRLAPITTSGYPLQMYQYSPNGRPVGTTNGGTYAPSSGWKLITLSLPDASVAGTDSVYITIGFSTGTKTTTNQNAILAFDDITITGTPIALPMSLTYFNGNVTGETATLKWQSNTEINANKYEVEAFANNSGWTKIAVIEAKGANSNYTIAAPIHQTTSYRLKMLDKDGSFTYSSEIILKSNNVKPIEVLGNAVKKRGAYICK